jgi:hypothetical protein
VRVKSHATHADQDKGTKYVVTLVQMKGMNVLAETLTVKIAGMDPQLLKQLPIGESLTLRLASEQVELETTVTT